MSDTLDGLSNIYSIQANLEALKNAKNNSAAALNTGKSQVDPGAFLLQKEQTFNTMLNTLISSPDEEKQQNSSNYFDFLDNSQNSSLSGLTGQQNTVDLQRLAQMEQYSPLIGRTATYFDSSSNLEKSGVIGSLSFKNDSSVVLVLSNGTEVPAGAVTGVK